MAIATKPKPKSTHHKKRTAAHHRRTKQYKQSYWPYLPMLAVIGVGLLFSNFMSHPRAVLGWQQDLNQEALLLATNNDRRANTAQALSLNPKLIEAAQLKAADMAQKNYWSHTSPSGKQPWDFVTQTGYQYQLLGENLAYGFTSADDVLNAWMHSPEHKTNVLERSYNQVGFGVAQSPNFMGKGSQIVVVAMYGTPGGQDMTASYTEQGGWLTHNTFDKEVKAVSRVEAIKPALSGLLIGVIGTLAVIMVLFRHAIAWRKLLNRGEKFVLKHPWLDVAFVVIAVSAVLLNQTVGFIR